MVIVENVKPQIVHLPIQHPQAVVDIDANQTTQQLLSKAGSGYLLNIS
jgi:hypothetical protein